MAASENRDSFGRLAYILVKFSLPLMLSGILQQLYNWADAFIVGNVVGELALAAVGSTTSMVNFYVLAITGFTLGLSILFAQKFGARELEDIRRILSTFLWVLGGIFLILSVLGVCFAEELLRLLHTTREALPLAADYLGIVLAGVPFLAVYNVYSAALRGIGNSRAPFYAVLLSSGVNVALDVLFVAVWGWGVAGAAIATVIAQAAMTVFLTGYSIIKYPILRFRPGRQSFDRTMLAWGCRFGIPPMLQSSVSSVGSLILQNFMNGFGTQTVAAVTTAYRVDSIVMVPILNLGSGISTLVAQNCGAGQNLRARSIFRVGTAVMAAVSLLLTVLVIPTGGELIALFGAGPEAVSIGDAFFPPDRLFLCGLRPGQRGAQLSGGDGGRGLLQSGGDGLPGLPDRPVLYPGGLLRQYGDRLGGGPLLGAPPPAVRTAGGLEGAPVEERRHLSSLKKAPPLAVLFLWGQAARHRSIFQ